MEKGKKIMKNLGIESKVLRIDEAYLNATFTVLKNIFELVDDPEQYPEWDVPGVKEKYNYQSNEFSEYINSSLELFSESGENINVVAEYQVVKEEYETLNKMKHMVRDILAIVNTTEQVDFFYNQIVSRLNLKYPYIASSAELLQVLSALENIIQLVDEDGNPVQEQSQEEAVPTQDNIAPNNDNGMAAADMLSAFSGLFAGAGMPMPGMMPPMMGAENTEEPVVEEAAEVENVEEVIEEEKSEE